MLHSGTEIKRVYIPNNQLGRCYQAHWDEKNKEVVILSCWYVDGGDGDVMPEFEEQERFTTIGQIMSSIFNPYIYG